jgi:hypothetical protein
MRYTHEVNACALTCALAVIVWSIVLHHIQMFRGRRLCPGPRHTPWSLILPWRWFLRPRCGYDLTGLRATSTGEITCPECARRLPAIERASTHTRRVRWQFLVLTLIGIAWSALSTPYMRDGRWIPDLPNWALIAHQRFLGSHGMGRVSREARERISSGMITRAELPRLIPVFIGDLRDDSLAWTSEKAVESLVTIGRPAMPLLEEALLSSDWQQRQLAAAALREIHGNLPIEEFPPSTRLLRVTAEALRDDFAPSERFHRSRYWRLGRRSTIEYLTGVGHLAAPALLAAMRGDDAQARLLAAGIAGMSQQSALLPAAAPILIEHLKSNAIDDDAKFASAGLFGFGPDVLPYLKECEFSPDPQVSATARLIVLDLLGDEDSMPHARRIVQVISTTRDDPPRSGGPTGYHDCLPSIDH